MRKNELVLMMEGYMCDILLESEVRKVGTNEAS
jgi:hypothetical protein